MSDSRFELPRPCVRFSTRTYVDGPSSGGCGGNDFPTDLQKKLLKHRISPPIPDLTPNRGTGAYLRGGHRRHLYYYFSIVIILYLRAVSFFFILVRITFIHVDFQFMSSLYDIINREIPLGSMDNNNLLSSIIYGGYS